LQHLEDHKKQEKRSQQDLRQMKSRAARGWDIETDLLTELAPHFNLKISP
jgi:hypothetical protein